MCIRDSILPAQHSMPHTALRSSVRCVLEPAEKNGCRYCTVFLPIHAVSYTHLDVYKRQDIDDLDDLENKLEKLVDSSEDLVDGSKKLSNKKPICNTGSPPLTVVPPSLPQ